MTNISRRTALLMAASLPLPALAAAPTAVKLYKNPQCTCCENYAEYLRKSGFAVTVEPTNDLDIMSRRVGVPDELEGCHLAFIDAYVVEGHVPVPVIAKLLSERPALKAITLPGMPPGSPGMTGNKESSFIIYGIGKDGSVTVFTTA